MARNQIADGGGNSGSNPFAGVSASARASSNSLVAKSKSMGNANQIMQRMQAEVAKAKAAQPAAKAPATAKAQHKSQAPASKVGGYSSVGSQTGTNSYGQQAPLSSGGGGGGGGGGAVDPSVGTQPPAAAQPPAFVPDDVYNAQLAALTSSLDAFKSDNGYMDDSKQWIQGLQGKQYDQDYNRNLSDLGWQNDAWNANDRMTSYGSAFQNQRDDFASRGMLDSTSYLEGLGNLNRGFDSQRNGMTSARDNMLAQLQANWTATRNEDEQARNQARIEAMARQASALLG